MQATILDFRRRMPEVLRALDRQESVTVLYRGRPRAVLTAVGRNPAATPTAIHPACGMWADHPDLTDVATTVRNLRRGRRHVV